MDRPAAVVQTPRQSKQASLTRPTITTVNPATLQDAQESPPATAALITPQYLRQQRENAKSFLQTLHAHNYGFADLVKENLDADILKSLYRDLSLPITDYPSGHIADTSATTAAGKSPMPPIDATHAVATQATVSSQKLGRNDYLARLAAAKSKGVRSDSAK